jgi:two-component system, CitB family, response regulator DctR
MKEIRVLIVEDDPMVADINKKFTEAVPGFIVAGTACNGRDALLMVEKEKPDLLILDVYMPDVDGVSVLSLLRKSEIPVDVIMVTAAGDTATVARIMRQGVIDYIVKPFKFERYKAALESYLDFRKKLSGKSTLNQTDLDVMLSVRTESHQETPKNFHVQTMNAVIDFMLAHSEAFSADEVAAGTGVSRVTARRYLEYLVTQGRLQMLLDYVAIGRPIHRFKVK